MAVFAAHRVKSCPRCARPIEVGDQITSYRPISGGMRRWAHNACGSAPAPMPVGQPEEPEYVNPEYEAPTPPAPQRERVEVKSEELQAAIQRLMELMVKGDTETAAFAEKSAKAAFERATQYTVGALAGLKEQTVDALSERCKDMVLQAVKGLPLLKTLEITSGGQVIRKMEGEVFHVRFDRVIKMAKKRKNIMLVGPTGCGKTHLAEQVSTALFGPDKFSPISCTAGLTEGKVTGRAVPCVTTGKMVYIPAEFVTRFETGGVALLDEFDACDPNVALVLNAAIANGYMPLMDRPENPIAKRHPDFVCIAACNTWGTGADRKYCGRGQMDEATLDRFRACMVTCEYSEPVERRLCPDAKLYATFTGWREKIFEYGLERVLSTRFMKDAYELLATGPAEDRLTMEEIEESFFGGWRDEEVIKVLGRRVRPA